MASYGSSDCDVRQTRLQVAKEKRTADEQIKEKIRSKRSKKMFAPRKLIGPRDLVVNSNLPKIKLEEDGGYSPQVKQERLEVKSTSSFRVSIISSDKYQLKKPNDLINDNDINVKQKVIVSRAEEKINGNLLPVPSIKLDDNTVLQKHIELLKVLITQKDREINLLKEGVHSLQLHLNAVDEISLNANLEMNLDDSTIQDVIPGMREDNQVARLTANLSAKDNIIKMLTTTMIKLQNELLENFNNSLQIKTDSQISDQIVQQSFEKVLPFLVHDFDLKDMLSCRGVCHLWRNTMDAYLSNHPSMKPFSMETSLREFQQLEVGIIPKRDESPLTKLDKIYTFSDLRILQKFIDNRKMRIIGSSVGLDDIMLDDQLDNNKLANFLENFSTEMKYIKIRQCVDLPDFKIDLLMERIKLCIGKLTKLKRLKVVFRIDTDKNEKESGWKQLEEFGRATNKNWQTNTFPKSEYLESVIFEVEIREGCTVYANFLRNFCKSVIKPYSKQLKQLNIFAHGIGNSEGLNLSTLVELTIPQRYLGIQAEFGCERVEKCRITSCVYVLTNDVLFIIKRLFPKLISIGFKFEYTGGKFENLYWTQFTPKLSNVKILELENCFAVTFNVLSCFPNVRYLKFINKEIEKVEGSNDDSVLNIIELWQGKNLYEFRLFWDQFPNIYAVKLELSGETGKMIKPKCCIWTRKGYNQCTQKFDEFLLSVL